MDTVLSLIVLFAVVAILSAVYLLPAVIAAVRHHPNVWPIVVLDVLLGWMVLPWVAALCWSLTAVDRRAD